VYEGTQNRSKITIELNIRDSAAIKQLQSILPVKSSYYERQRITNFGYSHTAGLRICNRAFTDEIKELGCPSGRKSAIIKPPETRYRKLDYIRGLIDGDGTVGQDKSGFPFIGFITQSNHLLNFMPIIYLIYREEISLLVNQTHGFYFFYFCLS